MLHGSPGSGKTTLAGAAAECLRVAGLPNAVIDLDDLSMVHPPPERPFARRNLAAIWPHYAALPGLKVLLPSVLADEEELHLLRAAVPGATLTVCELTAPIAVLKDRVTRREPNEHWRSRLRDYVDLYHGRSDLARIRDFQVVTHDRSIDEAAHEVLAKAGWWQRPTGADVPA